MNSRLSRCVAGAALILSTVAAHAVPTLTVNGRASNVLAPPAPSTQSDTETGSPLARTVLSVADEAPGAWRYLALSDITTPKLQVFGSLDNSAGPALGDGEVALLSANATLRDTLTLTVPTPDPYLVTADMIIDGVLQGAGSNARVNALLTISPVGALSQTENSSYTGNTTVTGDTLSITRQFVGDAEFDLSSSLFFFVTLVDAGASVMADFSHTAIINLSVTTLGGDPIENVVLNSGSGNFGVTPVPLPASLPLLVGAVVGLTARVRRRAG